MLRSLLALVSIAVGLLFVQVDELDIAYLKKLPVGSTTKLSSLPSFTAQAVCRLQPYQDRLNERSAWTDSVNAYLAANNIAMDEGEFAFVLIRTGDIEVLTFGRSRQLDSLETHSSTNIILPEEFLPKECASRDVAAIYKFQFQDRPYILFGKLR